MAKRRWKMEDIKAVVDGENPFVQFGYEAKQEIHQVGDEWTDVRGKTWKKTEAGIISVNKQMDAIREMIRPRCKNCGKDINLFGDKLDRKVFPRTERCFDCLQSEEFEMKMDGTYQKYEHVKMTRNRLSMLKEFKAKVEESINWLKTDNCKIEWVTSNGDITTWTGAQNAELLKEAEKDLVKAGVEIEKVEKYLSELEA